MLASKMTEYLRQKKKIDNEIFCFANKISKSEDELVKIRSEFSEKNRFNQALDHSKYQKICFELLNEIDASAKTCHFLKNQSTDLFLHFLKSCGDESDQFYQGKQYDGAGISSIFMMLKGVFCVGNETMTALYQCLTYNSTRSNLTYQQSIGNLKVSLSELTIVLNEYESKFEDLCLHKNNDISSLEVNLDFSELLESVLTFQNFNIDRLSKNELGVAHRKFNNYLSDMEDSLNGLKDIILHKNIFKAKNIIEQYNELKEEALLRKSDIPEISINDIGFALLTYSHH